VRKRNLSHFPPADDLVKPRSIDSPMLMQNAAGPVARANAEGLKARFLEGDAENLPFEDGRFDVVISLVGAMFAPRPER
jgi:ubiquinone/menaquinone biosynthesis C-methylase UbiE